MISAGDFKNGLTFEMDGNVMQVIEFQHVKPGKGAAFVRAKLTERIPEEFLREQLYEELFERDYTLL